MMVKLNIVGKTHLNLAVTVHYQFFLPTFLKNVVFQLKTKQKTDVFGKMVRIATQMLIKSHLEPLASFLPPLLSLLWVWRCV